MPFFEAGGGNLVAQRGRQTGDRRAVEDGNGDVAGLDRGAVVRMRVGGIVTAVVTDQLGDAVGGRAAEDKQAGEGDHDRASADPATPGLEARALRHGRYAPRGALGCSTGPLAQPLYVTRLREKEGRERDQADERDQPRGTADLLDYPQQQGSICGQGRYAAALAPGVGDSAPSASP